MSMFMAQAHRGFALGAKYGVFDGFRRFQTTTETPKMDDSAMQGAIGIIIAVGGVLIALYIIAVVVGSISYAVTSGNIKLSPTWNNTITNIDSQAQATFNLAKFINVNLIKGFICKCDCAANSDYRGGYPYDRYRCILRSWHLSMPGQGGIKCIFPGLPNSCRTSNTVATI
jgi:hypothetical protein